MYFDFLLQCAKLYVKKLTKYISRGDTMEKSGLIVEGGGMKCAYSAGILDAFLDDNVTFDYCMGVSAGAANTVSYLAGQRGRNLRFYIEHVKDPRYISIKNLIKTGSLFGLQYIYGTLTNSTGNDPLDYDALVANPSEFHFPATNAATGKAEYFSKEDLGRDDYRGIMATCALPGFCKPISFHGNYYYDGGVADSIPVERAIADGCDKVVIIYCRPLGYVKQPESYRFLYKKMLRKFPNTITAIDNRHLNYRHSVEVAAKLQKEGRAFLFAPSHQVKIGTFTTDPKIMQELYDLGISDYKAQKDALRAFLNN